MDMFVLILYSIEVDGRLPLDEMGALIARL